MISETTNLTFVWRCSGCPAVYDGETLQLLLDDGTRRACSCGGRLIEDIGPVPEHAGWSEPGPRVQPGRPPARLSRVV